MLSMNTCLHCGAPVKNKYCNVSCQNRHQKRTPTYESRIKSNNTRYGEFKKFNVTCAHCNIIFDITEREKLYPQRTIYFCSRSCANSRIRSNETKLKISNSCKTSEKVKIANRNIAKIKNEKWIEKTFTCLYCGKIGYLKKHKLPNQIYHKECWLKISGGIKHGSSRGKCGWYNGYWCDSSYELAYLIYNLEHNIEIERNTKGFEYSYNGKKHVFYPDFRVNSKLVEIKNYRSELTDVKLKSVDENITIYYKDTIIPYLNYAISKYGKHFIELYSRT